MTRPTELCINDPPPPPNTRGGEIETFKVLEMGSLKWRKEHIPRDGNDLTEEDHETRSFDAPDPPTTLTGRCTSLCRIDSNLC